MNLPNSITTTLPAVRLQFTIAFFRAESGKYRVTHQGKPGKWVKCVCITPIHPDDMKLAAPLTPDPDHVPGGCKRCGLLTDEPSGLCAYCKKEVPMIRSPK